MKRENGCQRELSGGKLFTGEKVHNYHDEHLFSTKNGLERKMQLQYIYIYKYIYIFIKYVC